MGDAFLGILPTAESTVLACFAVAHALDQQCEWISNIQDKHKDSWSCSPGGPSLKIAVEFGRLDASTIYSRKLGRQPFLIGDAINYAARIIKAPIKGNRCVVGPVAAKTGFAEYNLGGPHNLTGRPKPGEPKYEYYRFPMSDVWRESQRKRCDSSYWG